jgi:hypothetical protein
MLVIYVNVLESKKIHLLWTEMEALTIIPVRLKRSSIGA